MIYLNPLSQSETWCPFKCAKNVGNFLVRSSFQTNDQPGTFKCTHARCKTRPFIHKANKISGPKRSFKINDHFTWTAANVIYFITCTYCKKIYIGETGRRLGDWFREHSSYEKQHKKWKWAANDLVIFWLFFSFNLQQISNANIS